MKYIYLDNNIVIDLKNKRHQGVIDVVDRLKNGGHRIVFSPAHLEEIANTVKHHGQSEERADEKVLFLKELTDSYCFLPYPRRNLFSIRNNGINTYKEDPVDTYERVLSMYDRNIIPEQHQKDKLLNGEKIEESGIINKLEANNSDIQVALEEYRKDLKKVVRSHHVRMKRHPDLGKFVPGQHITASMLRFGFIRSYFPIFEMVVEKLMEHLESQRYFPDKSEKYVASLHDTSHAIYAAYSDVFVTNDANFARKVKAVYQWLGVETKVMSRQEFLEYAVA
jgi:predicted nucleic acid-binding protein